MDVRGAKTIQYETIPNAITHTASDWDVEVWTTDSPTGQAKFYTDAFTNGDAIASVGGDATTQYDVSNPSGYVFRYTFDGTGTDPTITGTDPAIGSAIVISGFAAANNGSFIIIGAGTNYIEVFNASGAAETNKTSVNIYAGTNAADSSGITVGHNYEVLKVSENGALRADVTVTVSVTKNGYSW